jgi:hypothetical protein
VPEASNTSFDVQFINGTSDIVLHVAGPEKLEGGLNNQTLSEAGAEANLDVQFGFGLTFPTPGLFWSTGGSPPFNPDSLTPTNTNEPYLDVSIRLFLGITR